MAGNEVEAYPKLLRCDRLKLSTRSLHPTTASDKNLIYLCSSVILMDIVADTLCVCVRARVYLLVHLKKIKTQVHIEIIRATVLCFFNIKARSNKKPACRQISQQSFTD